MVKTNLLFPSSYSTHCALTGAVKTGSSCVTSASGKDLNPNVHVGGHAVALLRPYLNVSLFPWSHLPRNPFRASGMGVGGGGGAIQGAPQQRHTLVTLHFQRSPALQRLWVALQSVRRRSALLCCLSFFMVINCSYVTVSVVFSFCRRLPLFFSLGQIKSFFQSFVINPSCPYFVTSMNGLFCAVR